MWSTILGYLSGAKEYAYGAVGILVLLLATTCVGEYYVIRQYKSDIALSKKDVTILEDVNKNNSDTIQQLQYHLAKNREQCTIIANGFTSTLDEMARVCVDGGHHVSTVTSTSPTSTVLVRNDSNNSIDNLVESLNRMFPSTSTNTVQANSMSTANSNKGPDISVSDICFATDNDAKALVINFLLLKNDWSTCKKELRSLVTGT